MPSEQLKTRSVFLPLVVLALLQPGPSAAAELDALVLSEGWRFQPAVEAEAQRVVDTPADLAIASGKAAGAWSPIKVPGGWYSQGFNPSRAGWYRCEVELPEGWSGLVLALEVAARCRAEAVYANGVPVGAHIKPDLGGAAADRSICLIPPQNGKRGCTIALRLDAPGVRGPGMAAPPILRPATAAEYMTPGRAKDGRLLHRPDGLDFFPNDPVVLKDLLVNVAAGRRGCAFVLGEGIAAVKVVVANTAPAAADDDALVLGASYTITDDLTGAAVSADGFTIGVRGRGVEERVELFAERAGSFTIRFLYFCEGIRRPMIVHYSVFPKPWAEQEARSPFGLILTASPQVTKLSASRWIMRPAVLTDSFAWDFIDAPSTAVLRRMEADAKAIGYNFVCQGANPPHIRAALSPPNDPAALGLLKRSYLREKASGQVVVQLSVPSKRTAALDLLLAQGAAQYCDALCMICRVPADFEPETFVPEQVREMRSILAEAVLPPAPVVVFESSGLVDAAKVVRSCLTAVAAGVWKVFWDADGRGEAAWLRPDGSAKAQLPAMACLSTVLREARYLGRLETGASVHALAFHNGIENVLAVWKTGAPAVVRLPAGRQIVGMMGQTVAADTVGGMTDVLVSDAPIYLCGVDAGDLEKIAPPDWMFPSLDDLIARVQKLHQASPAQVITARTEAPDLGYGENELGVELTNWSGGSISAEASLELPEGWSVEPKEHVFALEPASAQGRRATLKFSVKIPSRSPVGEYSVPLTIAANGVVATIETMRLNLTTPVGGLTDIRLAEVHTPASSMAVPVRNPFARPVEARVGLSIANWKITPAFLPVRLNPGEEKLLRFLVSGRLPVVGPLQVTVTISQKDGTLKVRRRVDISRERIHGWAIGMPEVQTLRFDGRLLSYKLSKMAVVSVRVYDSQGNLVRTLDSGWQSAGPHEYEWMPEREFDEFGGRVTYHAEVRAGLDVLFDRQVGAGPGAVFRPRSVGLGAEGSVHVFEGRRVVKFTARGKYAGCDLPSVSWDDLAGLRPLPGGTYVALRGDQLLLLDARGAVLQAMPPDPRPGGDIAPGHFRDPASLAASRAGVIYVADTGNHRIQRFDSRLQPLPFPKRTENFLGRVDAFRCPVAGTGDGGFIAPEHVAVSPEGNLAVLDAGGLMQMFNASGDLVKSIETPLRKVACFALGADAIFVVPLNARRMTKYSIRGEALELVEGFGTGGSASVGESNIVWVEADGDRLLVCGNDPDNVFILSASSGEVLGTLGGAPPEIATPAGIDVDEKGNMFVTDPGARNVLCLSSSGGISWAVRGLPVPIELQRPSDVALDPSGRLYVLDSASPTKRLALLDCKGQPIFGFNGSYLLEAPELDGATAVEVTNRGGIWVGDVGRGAILSHAGNVVTRNAPRPYEKASAGGMRYLPWPEGGACGIIVTDTSGREIARKGGLGTGDGKFAGCMPGGVAARAGAPGKPDFVYYADTYNHRITVLRVEWNSISQAAGEW